MDSNFTRLGYVEETTFGTTPSANLQLLRRTGGNIRPRRTTVTSEEIRSDLRAGKPVRTAEWAQGDVNVEWSYGTLDDMLEGLLMGTWNTNVLIDGTTHRSYTFEDQFVDTNVSPDQFMIYKGCRVASLSMSLGLGAIVRGSLGILGATPSIAQASAGTGNTNPTTTGVLNTVDMVTDLEEGAALGTNITRVTGMDLNITRALRAKHQLGSLNPFDIGVGRLMVTGTITQYFENDTLVDAWFAFGDRALKIELTDDLTNAYSIEIPQIKYVSDLQVDVPGPDGDCMVTVNFEAYTEVGDAHLIEITRTPT